jgi:hypothetical protein
VRGEGYQLKSFQFDLRLLLLCGNRGGYRPQAALERCPADIKVTITGVADLKPASCRSLSGPPHEADEKECAPTVAATMLTVRAPELQDEAAGCVLGSGGP